MANLNVEQIVSDIESHYRKTSVENASLSKDYLVMKVSTRTNTCPYIALRVLNMNRGIRVVHFTGGWIEGVYTRETLKLGGYRVR